MAKKITEKMLNVNMVLIAVGTGLQAGSVYCLNLDCLSFSIFSRMRCFSSLETSICFNLLEKLFIINIFKKLLDSKMMVAIYHVPI